MNYSRIYQLLIQKRINTPISKTDCYVERHHIVPRSEGGTNDISNLVNLTAREHFIAHLLLARIYNDKQMWFALNAMVNLKCNENRKFKYNSRLFEHARIMMIKMAKGTKFSNEHREKISKSKIGKKLSEQTKLKMSLSRKGKHLGFKKGNVPWNKGKHHSIQTRNKISNSLVGHVPINKGSSLSIQIKSKISKSLLGHVPTNKGKPMSAEQKDKISKTKSGVPVHLEEHKKKLSNRMKGNTFAKGTHWFTNGIVEIKSSECPEGFIPGRKKHKHT